MKPWWLHGFAPSIQIQPGTDEIGADLKKKREKEGERGGGRVHEREREAENGRAERENGDNNRMQVTG